jgi:hypothetical protein
MANDNPEFGLSRMKNPNESFIGKYVIVYVAGNNHTSVGLLKDVVNGTFILNPHQGMDYSTGKPVYKMRETDKIGDINGAIIEETTLEDLVGYCEFNNSQLNKQIGEASLKTD